MKITFTPEEWDTFVAFVKAHRVARPPRHGQDLSNQERDDLCGAFATYCVCADMRIGFKVNGPMVGGAIVRATYHKDGHLLGQVEDSAKVIYISVFVDMDEHTCESIGWAYGKDLLKDENFRDHFNNGRPCYALEQSALYRYDDLRVGDDHVIIPKVGALRFVGSNQSTLWGAGFR